MSNAWNNAAGMADKHEKSSGVFARLANDGDKIVGAFCGEPHAREVVWNGSGYEPFDDDKHAGKRATLKVALNFYVPADGAMKVIEGSTMWFKDVLKVRDKYGLEKWFFEIERHGAAGNTKTKYTILPEAEMTSQQVEAISRMELHDLPKLVTGNSNSNGDADDGEDPTIDEATAAKLAERFRAVPRPEALGLLQTLKVKRVTDLRESDLELADHLLSKLEADQQPAEVDPFA